MHLLHSARLGLPQPGFDHPPAQGLFAYLDPVQLGQLLGRKCRPKIVPVRLLENRQRLSLRLDRKLAI